MNIIVVIKMTEEIRRHNRLDKGEIKASSLQHRLAILFQNVHLSLCASPLQAAYKGRNQHQELRNPDPPRELQVLGG